MFLDLSDLYTPSQTKLPENHTIHSATYQYSRVISKSYRPIPSFCQICIFQTKMAQVLADT